MAVREKGTNAGATTQTQPTAETTQQPQGMPSSSDKAPRLAELIAEFNTGSNLSAEGGQYVEKIRQQLEDSSQQVSIKMTRINSSGGVVFFHDNRGIVLIFDEAINGLDGSLPKTAVNQIIAQDTIKVMGGDFRLLNIIMVVREDYAKPEHMARHIFNVLRGNAHPLINHLTLDNMSGDLFSVDIDMNAVRNFVTENSPHKIPARGDIGFTINLREENTLQRYTPDQKNAATYVPLIGVTAFVDILEHRTAQGLTKFLPIVRITDIISVLPVAKVASLAIATAADIFIGQRMWTNQFLSFEADKQNIGNLVNDINTGEPWMAKTVLERDQFIMEHCEPAILAIDVTEGRARIPGIERFVSTDVRDHESLLNEFGSFLGMPVEHVIAPTDLAFEEFVGIVHVGADVADSRSVDFLTSIRKLGSSPRVRELLNRYPSPIPRADLMRELIGEFPRQYVNIVGVLKADLVRQFGQRVGAKLKMNTSFANNTGIAVSNLLAAGEAYGSGGFNVTSSIGYNNGPRYYQTNVSGMYNR